MICVHKGRHITFAEHRSGCRAPFPVSCAAGLGLAGPHLAPHLKRVLRDSAAAEVEVLRPWFPLPHVGRRWCTLLAYQLRPSTHQAGNEPRRENFDSSGEIYPVCLFLRIGGSFGRKAPK